jgi:cytochrome c oxidase cbb3-type subunit 3
MRFLLVLAIAAGAMRAQSDLAVGRKIFESQCALCHGQNGTGGRGPGLNRPTLLHAPDDAALRSVISQGIEPEMPGAWQLHEHEVIKVAAYVRSLGTVPQEVIPGDASRGETVYRAQGCGACHMVRGRGDGFGPELTDIGARRNAAYLRQTLLNPAGSLPEEFLVVEALTARGETVGGIRVNEDTFSIQLRDAAGRNYSFRKSELNELRRRKGATPMPRFANLAPGEMDDLVAYLAGLRGRL